MRYLVKRDQNLYFCLLTLMDFLFSSLGISPFTLSLGGRGSKLPSYSKKECRKKNRVLHVEARLRKGFNFILDCVLF